MMRGLAPLGCALVPVLAASGLAAQDGAISGRVDLGARFAFDDGLYAGQSAGGLRGTPGVTLESAFPLGAGEVVFSFEGLLDEADGRSQANLARLFYRQSFDGWDLIAGVNTENWAVVESASVMNVINPADNSDPVSG
ncbi:MAG: hypothetical protein EP307_14190, partial [Rhodobacteraceae bacterium]